MRIVSWNIRAGGGQRAQAIATQIARWAPDVVTLQEFRDTAPSREIAARIADRGLSYQRATTVRRAPAANALLLASRWPFRRIGLRVAQPDARLWLLVRVRAPQPFAVGALHIPTMVSGRKYDFHDRVLDIARRWGGGPALIIGDTNTGRPRLDEEAAVFGPREEAWMLGLEHAGWADAYRRLHGERHAYSWYSPNAGNGFRLDQAFVHRSLAPRLVAARYRWGTDGDSSGAARRDALSDHAALIVDFD